MFARSSLMLVIAASLIANDAGVAAQQKGAMADAQAKEAVQQFFVGFRARDVKALMKVVDVPFLREGGKNLETREALKRLLEKSLAIRDPSKDKMRIMLITTLPKLEEAEQKFTENERKAVQAVVGKDHRVVRVEWHRHGAGKHVHLFFIRLQKGQARIVGMI